MTDYSFKFEYYRKPAFVNIDACCVRVTCEDTGLSATCDQYPVRHLNQTEAIRRLTEMKNANR